MNKTTNIHLAQTLFSLDENAYALLKNYLENLELFRVRSLDYQLLAQAKNYLGHENIH